MKEDSNFVSEIVKRNLNSRERGSTHISSTAFYQPSSRNFIFSQNNNLPKNKLNSPSINSRSSKNSTKKLYGGYQIVLKHIKIENDEFQTVYAHCNEIRVEEGAEVNRGDVIATIGSTGNSTGNHLHFEVLVNGEYIDPTTVLPQN